MLLVRGMIAGMIAGLGYWAFAYVFGEPAVDGAIAFEDRVAAAAGEAPGEDLVSRGVQSTIGLGLAAVLYGLAVGGLFALVYAVIYGRVGRLSPRATAAVLALGAFVVVGLVPLLKYPANPPASTIDATVSQRTGLYLVMILFSVLLAIGAVAWGRGLAARLGTWNSTLLAAGAYVVAVGVVSLVMPMVDETPDDFPAEVLYEFRMASLGGQLVLWGVLGLVFGAMVDGSSRRRTTERPLGSPTHP
jgi:hypothetical protein